MIEYLIQRMPNWLPVWLFVFLVIVLSIFNPWLIFAIAFVLTIDAAIRMIQVILGSLVGLRRIAHWEHVDWRHAYEARKRPDSLAWDDVLHVVFFPNYKESHTILQNSLDRLAQSSLARTQVVAVLAFEADDPSAREKAAMLESQYGACFYAIYSTFHPRNLPGERRVKGANLTWAARQVLPILEEKHAPQHIVLTACDADSLLHPRYLDSLNCLFATSPKRYASVWQSPIRYHTNIWDIPFALDIIHAHATVWELAYLVVPGWYRLPISTYSLSWELVKEANYWDTDAIPDESHMYIKCLAMRKGDLRLVPIYLPFSGRIATGDTWREAFRNRYRQTVRHAWGFTEAKYAASKFPGAGTRLARALVRLVWRMVADNVLAGAGAIIALFGASLIPMFHPKVRKRIRKKNLLGVPSSIVGAAGVIIWAIDFFTRPKRERKWTWKDGIQVIRGFLLLPLVTTLILAFPALEAHFRLLLGRDIDFKVTRKE